MKSLHLMLASAPALVLFRDSPQESARHGTVLLYHGFGASKESCIPVLSRLATAGFLAVGIAGLSFGGFVSYAAVVADARIQAAAPVVGSPQWRLPWSDSPHLHLDRFYPTALLSQTAGLDTTQPPTVVRTFHQHLTPYYVQAPERLSYIEYPNSAHDLAPQDDEKVWNAVVHWFEPFLAPQRDEASRLI